MDNQVSKFLDIYDKENPQDKKLEIYGKKEQITNVCDSSPEIGEETDEQSAMNI
jgi:hypothetical protein